MIKKLGEKVGIKLNPHDLRRHSAPFASRNSVPLELISKVLLRHRNLNTNQLYLGRVSNFGSHPLDGYPSREMIQSQIDNFGLSPYAMIHLVFEIGMLFWSTFMIAQVQRCGRMVG